MPDLEVAAGLRVSQYLQFFVASQTTTADEVTDALGVQPDRVGVKGSKDPHRPLPVEQAWAIECRDNIPVHEQVARVLSRIREIAPALVRLLAATDANAGLMFVCEFGGHEGVPAEGQLGWWLDYADVALLADSGASIQSDEYGA